MLKLLLWPLKALAQTDPWDLSQLDQTQIQQASQQPLNWSDLNWAEIFSSHWHNRLVHFPLVLSCLLCGLAWFSLRQPQYQPLLRQLCFGSALLALLALITGQIQAAPFESGQMMQFVWVHRLLGYACFFGLSLAAIYSNRQQANPGLLAWGLSLNALLVAGCGFVGGLLSSH